MKPRYQGNGLLFLRNVFLYVLVSVPVLSLCLMGPAWTHLFLSMMTLSLVLLPAVSLLVPRLDGFSFDDQAQAFVRSRGGRPIPYSAVKRIELNETSGLLQVALKRGGFGSVALISTLDAAMKPDLIGELKKRLPGIETRERRNQDWKALALVGVLFLSATAVFHGYLRAQHPAASVRVETKDWTETNAQKKRREEHRTGPYLISVPTPYRYAGREGDMLFFEDRGEHRTEIKIVSPAGDPLRSRQQRFLFLAAGIGDYAQALNTAYTARFGIVPLALKVFSLTGMTDVRLASITQGEFRGLVTQGVKRGRETTHILIAGDNGRRELNYFISGPSRMADGDLRRLLAGMRHRPE